MNEVMRVQGEVIPAVEAEITAIESMIAGQVSQATIDQYMIDFRRYAAFAGPNIKEPAMLARWRQSLIEDERQYSVSRINRMLAAVRSIMTKAAEQAYIEHNVSEQFKAVKGITQKANKERRKANARTKITKEQMQAIVEQPDRDTPAGMMHYALLMTLRYSGLRISEAVQLKRSDIEYVTNDEGKKGWCVKVMGKNMTEPQQREIGPFAYDAIQQWLTTRDKLGVSSEWVFTGFTGRGSRGAKDTPITRQSAWEMVKRYTEAAELEDIKPHDFRRYVGTQLAKKDLRIAQKQLGHKRIETTVQNYVLDDVAIGNVAEL